MKLPFLPSVRPVRKCRAGKQNFNQVLPWANYCGFPQVPQFFEIPTLFCPNGLIDVIHNFLIWQWTESSLFRFFCIFLQKLKKWHMCKKIAQHHCEQVIKVPFKTNKINSFNSTMMASFLPVIVSKNNKQTKTNMPFITVSHKLT